MDIAFELAGESFVWNRVKAETNWKKHGVSFEEAASVFFDPLFVLVDATRDGEARQAAIGFASTARLLYVVHIEIDDSHIRIVSARRAERDEENRYAL